VARSPLRLEVDPGLADGDGEQVVAKQSELAGGEPAEGVGDRHLREGGQQAQHLVERRLGGEVSSTAGGGANLRDDPEDPNRRLVWVILGAIADGSGR
jgi:hypothetical protein